MCDKFRSLPVPGSAGNWDVLRLLIYNRLSCSHRRSMSVPHSPLHRPRCLQLPLSNVWDLLWRPAEGNGPWTRAILDRKMPNVETGIRICVKAEDYPSLRSGLFSQLLTVFRH